MIIFLNFTPIQFMGGAERWMLDISSRINKKEKSVLMSVSPSIANVYGKAVLKRKYENRLISNDYQKLSSHVPLTVLHFIPLTPQWFAARREINQARIIYFRFEVLEIMILLYLGGLSVFNKSVAGIHSCLLYKKPNSFFDYLHKFVYESPFTKLVLKNVKKIHVLNEKDQKHITDKLFLNNSVVIPNGVEIPKFKKNSSKKVNDNLEVLFVGELSERKGIEMLCKVVENSPNFLNFHIAGDGPMKNRINSLVQNHENVTYHGYLQKKELAYIYSSCHVLFVPSQIESMSLVILEGMSYGLPVVTSNETAKSLKNISHIYSNNNPNHKGYISFLSEIYKLKNENKLSKINKVICKDIKDKFSVDYIAEDIQKKLFAFSD